MSLRISNQGQIKISTPSFAPEKTSFSYSSSLQSMKSSTISLKELLRKCFCTCSKSRDLQAIHGEDLIPEMNPSKLKNSLFKKEIQNSEHFTKISNLFFSLGTTHYWKWIASYSSLKRQEQEIEGLVHPLVFLYFVLSNSIQVAHLTHFQQQSLRGKWILQMKTGREPWGEMIAKLTRRITSEEKDVLSRIFDFCKALNLKTDKFISLAKQSQWKRFIEEALKDRQIHFNLCKNSSYKLPEFLRSI